MIDWVKIEILPIANAHANSVFINSYGMSCTHGALIASDLTGDGTGLSIAQMETRPDFKEIHPLRRFKKFIRTRKLIEKAGLGWCDCATGKQYDRTVRTEDAIILANTNIIIDGAGMEASFSYATLIVTWGISFRDRFWNS